MTGFYHRGLKNEGEYKDYVRATIGPVLYFALDSVAFDIPYALATQKASARDWV